MSEQATTIKLSDHQINDSECPTGGCPFGAATKCTSHPQVRPKAHDLGICAKYGEALEFDDDMNITVATLKRLMQMSQQRQSNFEAAQNFIRTLRPLG